MKSDYYSIETKFLSEEQTQYLDGKYGTIVNERNKFLSYDKYDGQLFYNNYISQSDIFFEDFDSFSNAIKTFLIKEKLKR